METRGTDNNDSPSAGSQPTVAYSSSTRPTYHRAPASNPNFSTLPPLTTSHPFQSPSGQRQTSYSSRHLSSISTSSAANPMSRPQSNAFPYYLSSLPYALVRDFAYPTHNPFHYGPPPDQLSQASTPASEISRRVSDPHGTLRLSGFKGMRLSDQGNEGSYFGMQLPARSFADGPPYAEDADLLSPIVTTTKHKKTKSNLADYGFNNNRQREEGLVGPPVDHGDTGAHTQLGRGTVHIGDQEAHLQGDSQTGWRRMPRDSSQPFDPNVAPELHASSVSDDYSPSEPPSDDLDDAAGSRLSRAYQFTIASPDEEFHGKAVALFDFQRENDNELPFIEGQVLWVSYRHGEGWLVAQDPKSGESGLIPEEYVRLLRDIEGGLSGLKGEDFTEDDGDIDTPIEFRRPGFYDRPMSGGSSGSGAINGDHYAPIVSHFTTSSRDLQPYALSHSQQTPQQQERQSQGQLLGSQQNTPVAPAQPYLDGSQFSKYAPHHHEEADGGGVLLSPETFKREELASASRRENGQPQALPNGDVNVDGAAASLTPQPLHSS